MIGKLSIEELDKLLPKTRSSNRTDILAVPEIGEDCGAVSFDGEICVVSTDPITATDSNIGYLSVNIACNDIYSCGGECVGLLVTLLAPPDTEFEKLQEIMDDIYENCKKLNIELLGGHTERTDAVNRIVVNNTVVGKTNKFITSSGAQPDDDIVLTKFCGLEGTQILVTDFEDELELNEEEIAFGKELLNKLSVGIDSKIALKHQPHAMHDVTDGGLFGALSEVLERSDCGAYIKEKDIPILPLTQKVCDKLDLSPYRLIGSGSLIICTPNGRKLCEELISQGINAAIIGKVTQKERLLEEKDGTVRKLIYTASDELYKAYKKRG